MAVEIELRNDMLGHAALGCATAMSLQAYLRTSLVSRDAALGILSFVALRRTGFAVPVSVPLANQEHDCLMAHIQAANKYSKASLYLSQSVDSYSSWWCAVCATGH